MTLHACGDASLKAEGEECFGTAECAEGLTCDFGQTPAVCRPMQTPIPDAAPPPPDADPAAPDADPSQPDAAATPDATPTPDAPLPDAAIPDATPAPDAQPDAA